ncbi:MAG: hypothetical protein AAGC70_11490 [Pseudomonadota bacterium]
MSIVNQIYQDRPVTDDVRSWASGLFSRLVQARERAARREVQALLAGMSDRHLKEALRFSDEEIRALRHGRS